MNIPPVCAARQSAASLSHGWAGNASFRLDNAHDLALGGDILFAHLQHQDSAFVVAQRVIKPGEHLLAPGRIERTAEDAVLNMVEPVVFAHLSNPQPDPIAGDVIDDKGE